VRKLRIERRLDGATGRDSRRRWAHDAAGARKLLLVGAGRHRVRAIPATRRRSLGSPVIHAERGATITIRLGFDPTDQVDVSIGRRHFQADPSRTLHITIDRSGLLEIGAHHGSDDASYYGRIRVNR
jgi:hypothetical protein